MYVEDLLNNLQLDDYETFNQQIDPVSTFDFNAIV